MMTTLETAVNLIGRGFRVVPIPRGAKGPVTPGWQHMRVEADQVPSLFSGESNIGIILGEPSGWLVDVDLDCPEACALAAKYLPATPAVSGRGAKPDSHWWYICEGATPKRFTDRVTGQMIAEIRSNGQQTVTGPSRHPTGDTYDYFPNATPATVGVGMLLACVEGLEKAVNELRHGDNVASPASVSPSRVVHQQDHETRAIAYLSAMPASISGSGGHNALYAAATAMVHGFEMSEGAASVLLSTYFNPRCVPPWTEKEIDRKCDEAAKRPHDQPHGWLKNAEQPQRVPVEQSGVDLSRIMAACNVASQKQENGDTRIPASLMRCPGLISDVMDLTLGTAPYPNVALAFAGALSLQSLIAGRKVRDDSDCRTNLFTLALADSGAGKDWPRKVNFRILADAGMMASVGDRVASGESLSDVMFTQPALLLQTDEIDEMFSNMKLGAESRYASFQKIIMTLWSSAGSVVPRRVKSGIASGDVINNPHLVLMGSAVPEHFFASLSESMITSGMVSRLLVLEAGPRGKGSDARIIAVPPSIVDAVKYWRDLNPGGGNLESVNPDPITVRYTDDGKRAITQARTFFDNIYDKTKGPALAIWSRACEQAKRLALNYAVSEDAVHPVISAGAVDWACEFAHKHALRLIEMAAKNIHDGNPHSKLSAKAVAKIEAAGEMSHSQLLRAMRISAKQLRELVETLTTSGEIEAIVSDSAGGVSYRVKS